jgi:hypothetical protein
VTFKDGKVTSDVEVPRRRMAGAPLAEARA